MNRLDPNKLYVKFHPGVTPKKPSTFRHYTLTHSDDTGNLFLSIALDYAYNEITAMRNEVLAEWLYQQDQSNLLVNIHVDSQPTRHYRGYTNKPHICKIQRCAVLQKFTLSPLAHFIIQIRIFINNCIILAGILFFMVKCKTSIVIYLKDNN